MTSFPSISYRSGRISRRRTVGCRRMDVLASTVSRAAKSHKGDLAMRSKVHMVRSQSCIMSFLGTHGSTF